MLATVFGISGIAANIIIYQQKNGKKALIYKLISDILWAIHYFLLDAYAGTAVAVIGIFREIVFLNKERKWAKSKLWLVFFIICGVACCVLINKNIFSILMSLASVLSVISFWRQNPDFTRLVSYPICFLMLAYDIIYNSYTGITNELMTLFSTTFYILKTHLIKKLTKK